MKKIMLVSAAAALLVFSTLGTALAEPARAREARQQYRIRQGVRSGEVTRGEYRALEHGQGRIEHARRNAWRDGHMSRNEYRRIHHMQDRASRNIYRARHNDCSRW